MATTINAVALLSVAAPALLFTPSAEAAVGNVVVKQSVSGNLIADRHDDDYEYSERHGRYIYNGRHRKHRHKHHYHYQYNNSYQKPVVIYNNKPVGIFAPPPPVYIPAPQEKRCVRTLYSTICN